MYRFPGTVQINYAQINGIYKLDKQELFNGNFVQINGIYVQINRNC